MYESRLVLFDVDGTLVAVRARDDAHAGFIQEEHEGDARLLGVVTPVKHPEFRRMVATHHLALTAVGLPAAPSHKRSGMATRWRPDESYGFIVDGAGMTWFVSRRAADVQNEDITAGMSVSFTGSPHTQGTEKYPKAYSVTPLDPDPEA